MHAGQLSTASLFGSLFNVLGFVESVGCLRFKMDFRGWYRWRCASTHIWSTSSAFGSYSRSSLLKTGRFLDFFSAKKYKGKISTEKTRDYLTQLTNTSLPAPEDKTRTPPSHIRPTSIPKALSRLNCSSVS